MEVMEEPPKIQLSLVNGSVLTFNANDYIKLRTEHRIVGNLIGVAVDSPRNSTLSGLPALYSNYEAKLMLDEGWVEIIKKEFNPNTFTDEKRDKYNAKVEQINSEQYKYLRDERIQQIRTNLDKIVAGRKKKLLKSGVPESEINIDPEEEVNKILGNFKSDPQKLLKQIPTQEIFDTGGNLITHINVDPLTYRVFRSLWLKEKYITTGENFGGDFLLYPGDPMCFHASHIIRILRVNEMPTKELIAHGRLGVNVFKQCVFVYENPENKELVFQVLHWLGNVYKRNHNINQNP